MKESVIVLNFDHQPVNLVDWHRAFKLILKGKAVVVEASDEIVSNAEGTCLFEIPLVIKLINYVKGIYKAKVSFAKRNVMTRDKHTCVYCGSKDHPTIDHIIPTSQGGESSWLNCVTACHSCNAKKGDLSLKDSNMSLRSKPFHPTLGQWLNIKIDNLGL